MSNIKLKGATSGESILKAPAVAGTDTTITLPKASIDLSTAGTDGQFLKTDGAGTLSFATVASDKLTHSSSDRVVATGDVRTYTDTLVMRNAANNSDIATYEPTGIDWYHSGTKVAETSANGLAFPSGKGIDFSATSDLTDMSSELLADYEEGTFEVTFANSVTVNATYDICSYIRIGNLVHVQGQFEISGDNSNADLTINNLPYQTIGASPGIPGASVGSVRIYNQNFNSSSNDKYAILLTWDNTTDAEFRFQRNNAADVNMEADAGAIIAFAMTYRTTY